ncbi:retinoid-inducible serine carboxypeptidase-like isoform X2 [Vespa crabro]|uniref:retinoid-inducible serine carboxypeptidase-like isoform X2 n=1 Tax=Vespa crabro TaxID=7445 RepID=UPI001F02D31E|nr:retinoid-inducible serine carboxypeptidase-like isoform X2 [Vespa crabro]
MYYLTLTIFIVSSILSGSLGKEGFGPGEQDWGHVTVRQYSHMFWWLYYTTANVQSYYERPLLIWLQGGPGGSSTSYGNFEEIGPLDTNLKARNYTWVKDYNVLFIDNPVGTGFSYVENVTAYAKTNKQIALDLVECMRGFLKELPEFSNVPTYILTESYGGKMGAEFALVWYKAEKAGNIKSNLKGVGLGDAWISPIDSVMTWAPFLFNAGMIDSNGYDNIDKSAKATRDAVNNGKWLKATSLWGNTENVILKATDNIDFYNILTKLSPSFIRSQNHGEKSSIHIDRDAIYQGLSYRDSGSLEQLMNGPVRKALGIKNYHNEQSNNVFYMLRQDFMKPVVDKGTILWVDTLKWKNSNYWINSERRSLVFDNIIEGYSKRYNNFGVYWVNRAGHMVPKDNPAAMGVILKDLLDNA